MKKLLALLLCFLTVFSLAACDGTEPSTDTPPSTDSSVNASSSESETEEWQPITDYENQVIVCDHQNSRIVVYDMSRLGEKGNLDEAEIWEYKTGFVAGQKYREDTVYGDVVIFCGPDGPGVVTYPGKRLVWSGGSGMAGSNPHSIEILPSGNIVTASTTDSTIRIFNTKNMVEKKDKKTDYESYTFDDAHGVLWDPANECLWAVGKTELVAYKVVDDGDGTESLKRVVGFGGKLPTTDGHDLSADFFDSNKLWITTNTGVYHFDKTTGEFDAKFDQYGKLSKKFVKGFGNNLNGNYFYSNPNGGKGREWEGTDLAEWCTDTIYFCYWKSKNFLYSQACVSETSAFYKARVFYGKYQ